MPIIMPKFPFNRQEFLPIDGDIEEAEREEIEDLVFSLKHPNPIRSAKPESAMIEVKAFHSENEPSLVERAATISKINRTTTPNSNHQIPWIRRNSIRKLDRDFLYFPDFSPKPEKDERSKITKISDDYREPKELTSQIVHILKRHHRPLSLKELLDKLLAAQIVPPNHHLYSRVAKLLKNNYLVFKRTLEGTWTVRKGCRRYQRPEDLTTVLRHQPENMLNLVEVIVNVVKNESLVLGTFPALVHRQLQEMGYRCSLSSVKSAMQSPRFSKNLSSSGSGYWYRIIDNTQQG